MSWRTVIIANRCKLDLKMGYMVVRGEETKRVFLDEIDILLIENPAVSLTGCLLVALTARKIRVIFCDEKRNPIGELAPHYGCYDCSSKLRSQIAWDDAVKDLIWAEIVAEKLRNQARYLRMQQHSDTAALLDDYIAQIEPGDSTNREGHGAKVYFNALFGKDFTRTADTSVNAALNYGYSLLLSAFNREIAALGYATQLGFFHNNMFNFFNLSCDLMEPFRIAVDRCVVTMAPTVLDTEEKRLLAHLLHTSVTIANTTQTFLNAVKIYTRSIFDAVNDRDMSKIQWPIFFEET